MQLAREILDHRNDAGRCTDNGVTYDHIVPIANSIEKFPTGPVGD